MRSANAIVCLIIHKMVVGKVDRLFAGFLDEAVGLLLKKRVAAKIVTLTFSVGLEKILNAHGAAGWRRYCGNRPVVAGVSKSLQRIILR